MRLLGRRAERAARPIAAAALNVPMIAVHAQDATTVVERRFNSQALG